VNTVGESEQYLVGAASSARAWSPRVSWPVLLATFDGTAVLVTVGVAASQAVPFVFLSAYASVLMLLLLAGGVYSERTNGDTPGRVPFTLGAITLAAMGVITLNFMVLRLDVTPAAVLGLWIGTVGTVAAGRLAAWPIRVATLRAVSARKTVIVGSGIAATLLAEKISSHPELGLETMGFVDDGPRRYVRGRREPLLGDLRQLGDIIESTEAKVVVFAYTRNATPDMLAALYRADPRVEVLMMPRYFEYVSTGMQVEGLAGMPLLRLNRSELKRAERFFKRAEDVVIGGIAALFVLPFVPLIALAIKLDSPGPVFFANERVGKGGRVFPMYKFRSMSEGAEDDDNPYAREMSATAKRLVGARDGEPRLKGKALWRVTRVGKFLRSTSIDELPQLWNVLRGDMSLVGPRPPLREEVAEYEEWHRKRLAVSPGITGVWQVNGRSDLPFDEMVWLDFGYVDSWSLWLDFSILLRTVPAVLSRRGAY
jgi:exopolysaccharide biosynthesis polyprenyl glycosylphosphotransferase